MKRFTRPKFGKGVPSERLKQVLCVLSAALDAVEPHRAVCAHLRLKGKILTVGSDQVYDLAKYHNVYIVGGGKAGAPMAAAVEEVLGERVTAGTVNVKYGHLYPTRIVEIIQAGHPVPDANGMFGARRIAELAARARKKDLVICVISGGGSALMCLPADPITLEEMKELTSQLQRCGATINEINSVRKHVEQLKGGGLVRLASKATIVTVVLSDVVGNPPDAIASGPTVADPTTFGYACEVLDRYNLWAKEELFPNVASRLRRGMDGEVAETPKPGDPMFARTHYCMVGSNAMAAQAAASKAQALGFHPLLLSTYAEGEAREVGKVLAGIAKELVCEGGPVDRPACVIVGGETTVTLPDDCRGTGGRNQEIALSAAIGLDELEDAMVVCLATDGTDGPTDAAGALAHGGTVARAKAKDMRPLAYLENHDSYHFFAALGDLLICGPTRTNVNDLYFVFAW